MQRTSPNKSRVSTAKHSPNKSMRMSTSSPTKAAFADIDALQTENQNLQFALGDRDIEIERMKTTLYALNERVNVQNDIRDDIESQKAYL